MDSHIQPTQNRDISFSNDRCKCALCKNQLELQMINKKPLANIHLYHHLKKRQGPPTKKEVNKQSSFKSKVVNKDLGATPAKHKVDRSKEAYPALVAQQYHMVSHSQRLRDAQQRRDQKLRIKGRNNFQIPRLAEINENPENSKLVKKHNIGENRVKMDASPQCCKALKPDYKNSFK